MVWVFFPLCHFLNSFRSSVKGRLHPDFHVWFVLSPDLLATALQLSDSPEPCRSALFLLRGVTALQGLAGSRFPALLPGGGPRPLNELLSHWRNSPMELLAPKLRFLLIVISLLSFWILTLRLCFVFFYINPQHGASVVPLVQSGLWLCPEWDSNREDSFQSFH